MKRLCMLIVTMLTILLLSACGPDVEITDGIIDVQYDNIRYEGSSIVLDVIVTNGTDEDYYIEYMEFALYMPDEETEFCGAGFDILENVKSGRFNEYEIEFTSQYIYMTESDLTDAGIELDDLILFFWL